MGDIVVLSPRASTPEDITEQLAGYQELVRQRQWTLANGGDPYADSDEHLLVLEEAEELLRHPQIAHQVQMLARYGGRIKVKLLLLSRKPVGRWTLEDFGSTVLWAIASAEGSSVALVDYTGLTLDELMKRTRE